MGCASDTQTDAFASRTDRPHAPSAHFGSNVFGAEQVRTHLPKPMFAEFQSLLNEGRALRTEVADAIAHAVRVWAMERGATHFTHWFQPVNGSTAEKHDSFLAFAYAFNGAAMEATPIDAFSGSQLVQAEPDASSFPNGGMRNTFEARGYTVWDTTSPMFIRAGALGTSVLYIPSIFISYNGEALDEKTVLLRSAQALSASAVRLLRALGDRDTRRVRVNLGIEQEFFLVDAACFDARPDLQQTGRTLLGTCPPKTQQLEDHYFASIPSRVLAALTAAERELLRLGVPVKTRHNEVAPAQFEVAPVFEEAHVAVDHNLLTMSVLHAEAQRHGLAVLFHEKPFRGVNGSGKHCNWSVATDRGRNLLEPGREPGENVTFLCFLVGTLLAVSEYATLLRASIASCSNEHRLGAHEAPPSIISAFLGNQLDAVLDSLERETLRASPCLDQDGLRELKKKFVCGDGSALDLHLAVLPAISRDLTDRNRTSPFAFTGNKFEFRAVGSNQSPSFPVAILNCAVAVSLDRIADRLLAAQRESDAPLSTSKVVHCLRDFVVESKRIRFEGNGYSDEWRAEAERRGLPNIASAPDAFETLRLPANVRLLTEATEVFTREELESRYRILQETYAKSVLIEARNMVALFRQRVFDAALAFKQRLLDAVRAGDAVDPDAGAVERAVLSTLSAVLRRAHEHCSELQQAADAAEACAGTPYEQAKAAHSLGAPMRQLRTAVDELEGIVPDSLWPLCKYSELFFSVK